MEEIKVYDFKKCEKFSIENIKHLIQFNEEFCKTSNRHISYETKNENLRLSLDKAGQSTYAEFIENVESDSIVIEYNIVPLVNNLSIFIDKSVLLTLVDLMLGGNGKVTRLDREPTNIDLELIKFLIQNLLKRVNISYSHDKVEIVNVYTNILQYQKIKSKEMVFKSLIDVSLFNESIGHMIFCIPYNNIKSIVNELGTKINDDEVLIKENKENPFSKESFNFIKNIDIDVCAKLGEAKIKINDLINLEIGDVILLDQKINDDITVSVGGAEVYKGKPGVLGSQKSVQITEIINVER